MSEKLNNISLTISGVLNNLSNIVLQNSKNDICSAQVRFDTLRDMKTLVEGLKKIYKDADDAYKKSTEYHNHASQSIREIINPPSTIMKCDINGLTLLARKIDYIEEAGPDLSYMPKYNRFAFVVAGHTLIGNIGEIYETCPDPIRVRECKYSKPATDGKMPFCAKNKICNFYHNPIYNTGSNEPRNYFSSTGRYSRIDHDCCRFGSRSHLYEDLQNLTDDEIRRFEDFVVHLLLCLIILKKHGKQI